MSSPHTKAARAVELGATSDVPALGKLLGDWRRKTVVATLATTLLLTGWLTLPPARQVVSLPQPEGRVAPLLEAELARRQVTSEVEQMHAIGERALPYTVAIRTTDTSAPRVLAEPALRRHDRQARAGAGVVVTGDGLILSHADAFAASRRARIDRGARDTTDATVAVYEAASGLVLLAFPGATDWGVPRFATDRPSPGAELIAAAAGSPTPLLAPTFLSATDDEHYRVISGVGLPPGTPIFNGAGELLAVYGAGVAHDAAAAVRRLRALRDAGSGHHGGSGLLLQATNALLSPWFGTAGVVVTSRLEPGPAVRAGLRAGDVLLTVDDVTIESPEHLHFLIGDTAPGRAVRLQGRRAGRAATWQLVPQAAFELREAQAPRDWPERAPHLADLLPPGWTGSVLSARTEPPVPLDATVIAVDGAAVRTSTEVQRRLRRNPGGVLLYLDVSGERFFAVAREAGA